MPDVRLRLPGTLLGLACAALTGLPATAQVRQGALYAITLDSVNAGGAAVAGGTFRVDSSTGQDGTVGTVAGAVLEVCAGLWCESVDCDLDEDGVYGAVCGGDDCDDADPAVHPGAYEVCNGIDDDCDGDVDEDDAVDAVTWYADGDLDGYGDPLTSLLDCDQPPGHVANHDDCDDTDNAVHPGADEYCDGEDDDCDGDVDEDDAVDVLTWYLDADQDGYGNPGVTDVGCVSPVGYVENADDCDDLDAGQHPGADEYCNGEDDDCDGAIDDNPVDLDTWYVDDDGDGHGDPNVATDACSQPAGHVAHGDDCDDTDGEVHPGADEYCDGEDDDCDGVVDEAGAVDAQSWYQDDDEDGHGNPAVSLLACDAPTGYVANDGDCDDGDDQQYPGANEYCNGEDDDCDGVVDEDDAQDATTWYRDADGDLWGDPGVTAAACDPPQGFVAASGDCDDGDPNVNPGAAEVCNGIDDDCDAATDELLDGDGDGFSVCDGDCDDDEVDAFPGNGETCDGLDNDCDPATDEWLDGDGDLFAVCNGDCDDDEPAAFPGNPEVCDGIDNDCDGAPLADEADADEDGQMVCAGDCDDLDPLTWLGAPEQCDGQDNDCDAVIDEGVDQDGDGDGYNACQGDCDDTDPGVHPGAAEVCDGVDDDCDGALPMDELDEDGDLWLVCQGDCDDQDANLNLDDLDGDTWSTCDGDCDDQDADLNLDDLDGDTWSSCDGDCDDQDAGVNPEDADGDGHSSCDGDCDDGDAALSPADGDGDGFSSCDGDCDDSDAALSPEDADADGFSSCDGDCDDADPLASPADTDGDGWSTCDDPPDCADTNNAVSPGLDEVCTDGFDNNCDGLVDGDDPACAGDDDDDVVTDDDTGGDDDDMDAGGCECAAAGNTSPRAVLGFAGALLVALGLARRRRRRRPRCGWLPLLVVTVLGSASGARALPSEFNYQGRISELDGIPVDGPTPMTFRLYDVDQGGIAAWDEIQTVDVDSGVFSVRLGAVNPLSVDFTIQQWLEVEVDGDLMGTRLPLVPVPYAHHAVDAELLDGVVPAEYEESAEIADAFDQHEDAFHGAGAIVPRVLLLDDSADLDVYQELAPGTTSADKLITFSAADLAGGSYLECAINGRFDVHSRNNLNRVSMTIENLATGEVVFDQSIVEAYGYYYDNNTCWHVETLVRLTPTELASGTQIRITTTAELAASANGPHFAQFANQQIVLTLR